MEYDPSIHTIGGFDAEEALSKILDEEIWKEITASTGETKADLDAMIIKQILGVAANGQENREEADQSERAVGRE